MVDMDNHVTSVIQTHQQRLNSKPYVPSTMFGKATLVADVAAKNLFIAFPISDPDFGVQFLTDGG
jgi:hypothetical protein